MLRRVVVASLVVQLALGLGAISAPASTPGLAWADPVFEGLGVIDLLQPTGLVSDGTTPVDLYVLALTPDGAPIVGLKGKPTASSGTTTELTETGGGLYKFTFTPAKADSKQTVTLAFKSKLPSKEPVARTWSVSVAPPVSHQLSVSVNPTAITLGVDRAASLAFKLAGGTGQSLAGVDLVTNVTVGKVDNLTNLGAGQFSALYTPPTTAFPQLLLLTSVDRRDPDATFASAVVPLMGKVDFGVQVLPNSHVQIKIGDRVFGPILADAQGRASVPIIVPPGTETATKTQIAPDGKLTESPLDLKVPERRRVALFPTATAVPSDTRFGVPIRTLVVTPDGRPDDNALVAITSTAGSVSAPKSQGGGIYLATFTPPTSNANTQVTLTVSLSNGSSEQTDSTTLNLVPVRPAKVALTAEPALLTPTADGFRVFAKVTSADGQGLGGRAVTFGVNGGKVKEIKDLRNGDYQATFTTTGNGPVELTAGVGTAATGNPFARVLVISGTNRLANDGATSVLLTVMSVDQYGYPVGNIPVNLRLISGDGALPSSTTTGPDGTARVYYTAGRKAQTVSIEATANDATAAITLVQAPTGLVLPVLPIVATKAVAGMMAEWAATISPLRIEREGMTGAVLNPTALPAAAGDRPTKLAISSDPATVSPGGTVVLKLQLLNVEGRGIGGAPLEFLTSAGALGPISDKGNGNYEVTLLIPPTTTGEVKVSVATRDGLLSQFLKIPVSGTAAGWTGTNPFATSGDPYAQLPATTPEPMGQTPVVTPVAKAPKAPKPERAAEADGEFPWLRIRGGYTLAGYGYNQQPLDQSATLFPKPVQLDAVSQGGTVTALAFVPGVKYVGGELALRGIRYSLDPTALCEALGRPCADSAAIANWVTDVRLVGVARYPFESGKSQFWVGARVGGALNNVLVIQAAKNKLNLTPIAIGSLALGAELGANIGSKVFFRTDFTEYLAGFTAPYTHSFNVEGGFAFLPNVYASVAYDLSIRKIDVLDKSGNKIGEVSDVQGALRGQTNDQGTPAPADDTTSHIPLGFTFSIGAQF
ncbi:MAG: hypothetical protein EXR69_12360 [Myxococcales bacterium]|nr:hypothetical protein [Myxococcales bacterium]